MTALTHHAWPGNIRELENLIERLVVIGTEPEREVAHLGGIGPAWLAPTEPFAVARDQVPTLRQLEDECWRAAMATRPGPPRSSASTCRRCTVGAAAAAIQ